MSTFLKAHKVTSVLPDPEDNDAGATEASIDIKRTAAGRVITYVDSSDRVQLTLTWRLSRSKDAEVAEFISVYQRINWELTLFSGVNQSVWDVQLAGDSVGRRSITRHALNESLVELTLVLSAKRIS